jgi:hypothetical protein
VTLPPHVKHNWRNIGDTPGRLFNNVTPGRFEHLFVAVAESSASTHEKIARIEPGLGIVGAATLRLAGRAGSGG